MKTIIIRLIESEEGDWFRLYDIYWIASSYIAMM